MSVPEISFAELLGYVAAVVTLATYSMKTMIPLRISDIVANILFITFSYLAGVYPTLLVHHAVLLPVNSVRLYQMLQLVKCIREAAQGDLAID